MWCVGWNASATDKQDCMWLYATAEASSLYAF